MHVGVKSVVAAASREDCAGAGGRQGAAGGSGLIIKVNVSTAWIVINRNISKTSWIECKNRPAYILLVIQTDIVFFSRL